MYNIVIRCDVAIREVSAFFFFEYDDITDTTVPVQIDELDLGPEELEFFDGNIRKNMAPSRRGMVFLYSRRMRFSYRKY